MKKLLILFIAFATMQMSAQDLNKISSMKKMPSTDMSSSFVDKFAGDQVKKLTAKLKLNEAQQQQASDLVVSQLKSEKMQKLMSGFSADKLMGSSSKEGNKAKITEALYSDPIFKKEMNSILDDNQKKKFNNSIPKKM